MDDPRRERWFALGQGQALPGQRAQRVAQSGAALRERHPASGGDLAVAYQRLVHPPKAGVFAEESLGLVLASVFRPRHHDLLGRGTGRAVSAQRDLPASEVDLVLRSLRDRATIDLDQLVDQAGGRRTRADDHCRPGAVDIGRGSRQAGNRVLVEIAADDDLGVVVPERIELSPRQMGEHAEVAGIDADRAEPLTRRRHGVGDPAGDVVRVDEQCGGWPEQGDL